MRSSQLFIALQNVREAVGRGPEKASFRHIQRAHRARLPLVMVAGFGIGWLAVAYATGIAVPILLTSVGRAATHPLTLLAASLLAGAIALCRPLRRMPLAGRAMLLAVLAEGTLRLIEILGTDLGLSGAFGPVVARLGPAADGAAQGLNTVLSQMALAAGLLLYRRAHRTGFVLMSAALFLPVLSLVGYLLGAHQFYGQMSLTTAVLMLILGLAGLTVYAHRGAMRMFLLNDDIGLLLRSQIAVGLVVPPLGGVALGHLSARTGIDFVPLNVALTIWLISVMVAFSARTHTRTIQASRLAERELMLSAVTDPLTGLANRRAALLLGHDAMERSALLQTPMTVFMVDLDRFKKVNDLLGHPRGDWVLRQVAACVSGSLRRSDIVARWGGEEFVVILPGAGEGEAEQIGQTLCDRIAQTVLFSGPDGRTMAQTVSIGAAVSEGPLDTLDDMVARADKALYRAKAAGRNCLRLERPRTSLKRPARVDRRTGFLEREAVPDRVSRENAWRA